MEKALSMGAFTELDEREVMETEGGVIISTACVITCLAITGVASLIAVGTAAIAGAMAGAAERKANDAVNQYIMQYGHEPRVG